MLRKATAITAASEVITLENVAHALLMNPLTEMPEKLNAGEVATMEDSRGRGRDRFQNAQNRQQLDQGWQHQAPNDIWGGANDGWGRNSEQQQAFLAGMRAPMTKLQANNNVENPSSTPQGQYKGFMAKIKHKSLVACLSTQKKVFALIDSGATHHCFHDRSYFESYVKINRVEVEIASGTSRLVGKGIVTLLIEEGIKVTAYHAP